MLFEHIIYTAAVILIVSVFYKRITSRPYLWAFIILGSYLADIDHANDIAWEVFHAPLTTKVMPWVFIGMYHNLMWLVILSGIVAVLFAFTGKFRFTEVFAFCSFGYAIHLIEDYLVYPPAYKFLFPISGEFYGLNLIPETRDLGVAGFQVLIFGIIFLLFAIWFYSVDYLLKRKKEIQLCLPN